MSSEPSLSGECSLLRLRTCDLNQLGWLAPAGMSTVIAPQFPHSRSDCRRTQCDVLHPEGPGKRNLLEPCCPWVSCHVSPSYKQRRLQGGRVGGGDEDRN